MCIRDRLKAHLGETDLREVEKRIAAGDARAKEVCDAMLYQMCIRDRRPA